MKKLSLFLITAVILFSTNIYCNVQNSNQNPKTLRYDNGGYEQAWKTIDSLDRQKLPKSALEKVTALYERAKKDNNPSQLIKTIMYREKYQSQLEEDGYTKAIYRMEQEMETAAVPVKPILQSMLGEIYMRYLDRNYWKFQDRTDTQDFNNTDIRTWSVKKLIAEGNRLYRASLEYDDLENIALENFEAITTEGSSIAGLRPTLFDFLAHRAIDHFMNERSYLTEPANVFTINDKAAFAPIKKFTQHTFQTEDKNSNKYNTLLLFQKLLDFRANANQAEPLIDVDLKRLKFVKNNAVLPDKETLYLETLELLQQKYKNDPVSAEIGYYVAEHYHNSGSGYSGEEKDDKKWDWKKANDICKNIVKKFPDTYGASLCSGLIAQIHSKSMSMQSELVNVPGEAILVQLSYRNIPGTHMKLVKISDEEWEQFHTKREKEIFSFFNNKSPLKEWKIDLPGDGDFRTHSIEFALDPQEFGIYAVLASENNSFGPEGNGVSYLITHVSNIAYLHRQALESTAHNFLVTNRNTGHPNQGVQLDFFERQYNPKSRQNDFIKKASETTDKEGKAIVQFGNTRNFQVIASKRADRLHLKDGYSSYRRGSNRTSHKQTLFFTDRAIYRPGQNIHFKALLVQKDEKGFPTILANNDITITLWDVNGQEQDKVKLRSNEYGTVNGIFKAPKGMLLGQMSLRSDIGNGYHAISVEEYKRPKFEVTFKPIEGSYKLGDEINITGYAQALAGNNIDGAQVQYRIIREARFPYFPWWFYRSGRYIEPSNSMEIGNGTTTSDEKGEFKISFETIPDLNIAKEKKPQFIYRVYADVTDINGETRSGDTRVKAAYVALDIDVYVPGMINLDSIKQIEISSKNLNGNFEAATGNIKIERYQTPSVVYHKRYWNKPDKIYISEADFKSKFPQLPFRDEDEKWDIEKTVLEKPFNTADNNMMPLQATDFETGKYLLTLKSKDKYGEAIELKKVFTVFDFNSNNTPTNQTVFSKLEKATYEPGENAVFHIGSGEENLKAFYQLEHDGKVVTARWIDLGKMQAIKIPVEQKHRGNLHYSINVVHHNRHENIQQTIVVPWSNKDLEIEYASFRDKLSPGQKEEWQIKIKGPKSSKVAAEMLANMYDASLDFFVPNNWGVSLFPTSYAQTQYRSKNFSSTTARHFARNWQPKSSRHIYRNYKQLNWFSFPLNGNRYQYATKRSRTMNMEADGAVMEMAAAPAPTMAAEGNTGLSNKVAGVEIIESEANSYGNRDEMAEATTPKPTDMTGVKVRTNLNETVFFKPNLKTDADGNIIIAFEMNEALTRWKFQGFAHTKDLKFGLTQKEIVTQKELMVVPNAPRFIREGDVIEYTAKVSNMTKKELSGTAKLELFDAITMQPVDQLMANNNNAISFTVPAGQSKRLAWKLNVPVGELPALTHRVVARAGNYSDGEESSLPVLTNRMLVTESKVLYVRSGQTKTFEFEAMAKAGKSNTLQQHNYTLEFSSNPAWYAVQALPYMMEYPYECTEQIFNRFYANTLASHVANANPLIQETFKQWENTDAMLSNLSKNQELKAALLEETPWVLQAQSEEEQKKNIALLFDLNKMAEEQATAIATIQERQLSNGGFSWFPGGRDSWYITQYIVESMGHLHKLEVQHAKMQETQQIQEKATRYIEDRLVEHYTKLKERVAQGHGKMSDDHLDYMPIHFLYARSFSQKGQPSKALEEAWNYYLGQAEKYWPKKSFYMQGLIALALHRDNKKQISADIVKSFRERALQSEELGMYWNMDNGYMWYQLPIESHALMIEIFDEIANDQNAVDELRVWLLKNKQTTNWKTTKATAAAVYALLLRGSEWLADTKIVSVKLGGDKLNLKKEEKEAGTGYFKKAWQGDDISNSMATIEITNPNKVVAWGAVYWQYFEDLDKIKTFEETPLTIKKQIFLEKPGDQGPTISPVTESTALKPGDKLKVRIELRVDRDMEYVHMKDARASGFEPINVLSRYKWQGGLGYYESTKDASTNFFIDYLRKGTYVFEYPLRVAHNGDFSNGITSIQCMYAPEFSSHSEGIRIKVEE